jgi:hypothetical protein
VSIGNPGKAGRQAGRQASKAGRRVGGRAHNEYQRIKEEEEKCSSVSNANTHVNVLGQQLIRGLVLLDGVVVDAAGGKRAAEEEAEESISNPTKFQSAKQLK